MKQVLKCPICERHFEKDDKEINRRIRLHGPNVLIYCSISCGAIASNAPRIKPPITVVCKCGKAFQTFKAIYCSNSCAARYSMTPERIQILLETTKNKGKQFTKDNFLYHTANGLRKREWNKYYNMAGYLNLYNINHYFEYDLCETNFIYDLALFDYRVFIEFDEKYHYSNKETDFEKNMIAEYFGWEVYRIDVKNYTSPYPFELLLPVLNRYWM